MEAEFCTLFISIILLFTPFESAPPYIMTQVSLIGKTPMFLIGASNFKILYHFSPSNFTTLDFILPRLFPPMRYIQLLSSARTKLFRGFFRLGEGSHLPSSKRSTLAVLLPPITRKRSRKNIQPW